MQLFQLKTSLSRFARFAEFAAEFKLGEKDLVITNEFLYRPFMSGLGLSSRFVMQEQYGSGEPSDEMINAILADVKVQEYDRVIAVGGGTVIDISKLFALDGLTDAGKIFRGESPVRKARRLVILPTTCGTGSEVTNISIAEIKSLHTKMGLANDALLADDAVLIPELLKGLPYKFYVCSAIDALIHASESYVAPRSNPYTRLFCREAIRIILEVFMRIGKQGPDYRFERLEDMLMASNYAGIAFGNTGVGAVHALSYPLGGNYHVPHGEANYQFFSEVFKRYNLKKPDGIIRELNAFYAEVLHVSEERVFDEIDGLLGLLLPRNPLRAYGMKPEEIKGFSTSVMETQQRLLANNYVEFLFDDIERIYTKLF
ncbi:MAG: 4-hydroxybutyrate dehydrogenase [Marinifilaceae bacterium]|nr:4-hydroxybutyrate dehydrogenase [Marinifilaceae bacterium]